MAGDPAKGGRPPGPSGTEPVIGVMGEGDHRDLVESVVVDVIDALRKVVA